MKPCVLCGNFNTFYGIQHASGNAICMKCVMAVKEAHIKVREFPYEEAEATV
jgi:recombinational DNA repair protein (RecF pathway)